MDVYLYDSLSSGAGYSSRVAEYTTELLAKTGEFLYGCDCEHACNNCLKHYRNQYIQDALDRFAALELLNWGKNGSLPPKIEADERKKLFDSVSRLLKEEGIRISHSDSVATILSSKMISKNCIINPAMVRIPRKNPEAIYVTREAMADAKPFAIDIIRDALS